MLCLRSPAPRTEYKTPLIPKMHPKMRPKIHPESRPKTKIQKNTKKIRNPRFSYIFLFFSDFGLGGGFGVYFGVYFGDQRGFVFCTGCRRSQCYAMILVIVLGSLFDIPKLHRKLHSRFMESHHTKEIPGNSPYKTRMHTIGPTRITQLIPQEFSGVTEVNLLCQLIP